MSLAAGVEGAALRQIESSGNYSALGPVVKVGRYKGDRAYGAYQVMGKNIPSWTKDALGTSMTPAQYIASREAQDQVFNHRFGGYIKRYGSSADAASVWHSGSTLARAKARGATDGYMRTVDYVNKFSGLVDGSSPLTNAAKAGFSKTGQTEAPSVVADAVPQVGVAPIDPARMKAKQFAQDLRMLNELKSTANSTATRRSQIAINTPLPVKSSARTTQVLKSGVTSKTSTT